MITHYSKSKNSRRILSPLFLIFLGFALLSPSSVSCESTSQFSDDTLKTRIQIPDVQYDDSTVYMSIWILNLYDFSYRTGIYTFEMNMYFFWTNANISTITWNLINGHPVPDSEARQLVDKNEVNGVNYEFYSITARFSEPPTDSNFPFDAIKFVIALELLETTQDFNLLWLEDQTGVSSNFYNPGWKTTSIELSESEELNPFIGALPRAEMKITQERTIPGMIIVSYLPPLIFAILAGCSFLFVPKSIGLVGTRIALISSMMVSMIVFVFTAISLMPVTSTLPQYGIFILSIIIFLTTTLIVSVVSLAYLVRSNDQKHAQLVNRIGFVISLIIPILFFLAFYF